MHQRVVLDQVGGENKGNSSRQLFLLEIQATSASRQGKINNLSISQGEILLANGWLYTGSF